MKNILFLLCSLIFFNVQSQNKKHSEITKKDLLKLIQTEQKNGKLHPDAILVIDKEIILSINELDENQTFFGQIKIIGKNNKQMTDFYGEKAINGTIFINTIPEISDDEGIYISDKTTLFFVNSKETKEEDLKKLNPENIKSIEVVKSKKEIEKITNKKCDAVILILLKE